MSGRWSGAVIGLVFLSVIIIWALSLLFVPYFATILGYVPADCSSQAGECKNLSAYGVVGDLFGAVNSLFSGLALAAIALTLWIESRSRRESRKPLVLGSLDQTSGVEVFAPDPAAQGAMLFRLTFGLQNQTADAALNVAVSAQLKSRSSVASRSIDEPLLHQIVHEAVVDLIMGGTDRDHALAVLTSNRPLEIDVLTKYRSLEGLNWKTFVTYELRCDNQRDIGILNAVRLSNTSSWPAGATVALRAKVQSGSWNHDLA